MSNIITITDIKNAGINLAENVDTVRYDNFIMQVETSQLKYNLGVEFYNYIKANLTNAKIILLLPYIKNYLIWASYIHILNNAHLFDTAIGLVRKISNNSTAIESDEISRIVRHNSKIMQIHETELYNFLCLNVNDYPLWINSKTRPMNEAGSLNFRTL
jgi:hypothetical protein